MGAGGKVKVRSWPELKYPSYLDKSFLWMKSWLDCKRIDDGAEGLWRVYDKLYDLSQWMDKHPGGEEFLTISKGTDITELFETHHFSKAAEKLLPQFYVRDAASPRNSPYTFHPNGFYKTLKKRIAAELPLVPASARFKSKVTADLFVATAFAMLAIAASLKSYAIGTLACFPLCFGMITGHNFLHQKTSFRKYYLDFLLTSHKDWLITHVMSHHMHTNTKLDLEVTLFMPFFKWLSSSHKNIVQKHMSRVYAPVIYAFTFIIEACVRLLTDGPQMADLMNLFVPGVILVSSSWDVPFTLRLYLMLALGTSTIFVFLGKTTAHHAPDLFHEGDVPRKDCDWGLMQLDSSTDREETFGNFYLSFATFGDHSLHHLFPTLDHGILEYLHPVFLKTCEEFGHGFKLTPTMTLVNHQFQQLSRDKKIVFPQEPATKKKQLNKQG